MVERLTGWTKLLSKIPFGKILSTLIVFTFVMLSWNYFRSKTMDQANDVFYQIFSFHNSGSFFMQHFNALIFLGMAVFIELIYLMYLKVRPLRKIYKQFNLDVYFVVVAFLFSLFLRGPAAEFIYFQF